MTDRQLWTVEDTAAFLRLKPSTVRQMARDGRIPAIKVGRRVWRFDPGRIQEWLGAYQDGKHGNQDGKPCTACPGGLGQGAERT